MSDFVHLHVHSEFSMLDGAIRLKALAKKVKAMGQPAVALTDHGNMHAAVQFVNVCNDQGIKPIVGCEVNLVMGSRKDLSPRPHHHLVLLAESQKGYENLSRIVSLGWVDGMDKGVPRVDLDLLREQRDGIVALTGCMGGYVAQEILMKGEAAGRDALGLLAETFNPGSLYAELQDHGFVEQEPLNEILSDLAKRLGIKTVASNDCHYLSQDDSRAQLVLQCIGAGRLLTDMERAHHGSSEIYLKSSEEMIARFQNYPDAIKHTLEIAERCGGACNPKSKPKLPRFTTSSGLSESDQLIESSKRGLEMRIAERRAVGKNISEEEYQKRLDFEMNTIIQMGFPGYFLIVSDFINWAKDNKIPVGPGRGSGAGSIVAYALRITDLDPIEHGLLFERFLNPERVSMPDFDVDFCMDRRDEVINYVKAKYGETSVGQIATFHQLKSRSVVKDVGRSFGMLPADTARIASMIPDPVQGKTVPIEKAMEQEAKLKASYDESEDIKLLLDTAMKLEDLNRHAGMHAAGVVISEGALWDHVPVFCPEPGIYVTQYHKDDVEYAGLVKFDFLGLKTLTVIDIAVRLIDKRPDRKDNPFDLSAIPMDDKATYALLQSGETTNVFQLESSGMQGLFKKLKPDVFEDIVAAVALYRPGPLETGMVDDFVQRKHGRIRVAYPDACLEPVLKDTYGVIVYQEQVMEIARVMAGYTLGGADLLRRAMGKKKAEEMAKQRQVFVDGAVANGHQAQKAGEIFDLVEKFAGYGFNKSHSAAYALITYQTAYLKAHYPAEFVCATLSADKDKIDKVVRTVAEARSMGVTVLPPDTNESHIDFTVVYEPVKEEWREKFLKRTENRPVSQSGKVYDAMGPKIRFGLGGVKGIGEAALQAVFEARREEGKEIPFADLFDFASRVDLRRVNKGVFEALVQSGAFDLAHEKISIARSQAFVSIELALERGKRASADRLSGQTSLFGMLAAPSSESGKTSIEGFPNIPPWDLRELLQREKTALGFYVSGHPLDRYRAEIKRFGNATTETLANKKEGSEIRIGGTVENYRERPTKTGGRIGFFDLEDSEGRVEVVVRDKVLEPSKLILSSGEPVYLEATVRFEQERGGPDRNAEPSDGPSAPKLILNSVKKLADALAERAKAVRVTLKVESTDERKLTALKNILAQHPGKCALQLEFVSEERWTVNMSEVGWSVEPSDLLLSSLERVFGEKVAELR